MTDGELTDRVELMIDNCKHIGDEIHLPGFRKNFNVKEKSFNNFVTDIDLASDHYFKRMVEEKFPLDSYYSEECGFIKHSSGVTWIVDPLDGTHMYMNGFNHWCITSALMVGDEIVAGCVYSAVSKDLYVARKGEGAYLNGSKIFVRNCDSLQNAFMMSHCAFRKNYDKFFPVFDKLLQRTARTRAMGCMLDVVSVAAGFADFYIGPNLSFYDIAGPAFIVCEAGGKVCNWKERAIPNMFDSSTDMICGSENIVNEVLRLINS